MRRRDEQQLLTGQRSPAQLTEGKTPPPDEDDSDSAEEAEEQSERTIEEPVPTRAIDE